jgi:DivIVA domain-containing protein
VNRRRRGGRLLSSPIVDRDLIQRRDFPRGRRGYDIDAVDAHLRRVADAFEQHLPATAPRSLAATTSEQVRAILEAAEHSVAEVRAQAGREASEHVARVQAATDGMLSKLDALESELTRLRSSLRAAGETLTEGLSHLQADVSQGIPPTVDAPPAADVRLADQLEPPTAPAAVPAVADGAAPPADSAPAAADVRREAGARLVALNMALGGSSREETSRYLAEHFVLSDADALLDDVYARAGR